MEQAYLGIVLASVCQIVLYEEGFNINSWFHAFGHFVVWL